jgi:hypothetical protein
MMPKQFPCPVLSKEKYTDARVPFVDIEHPNRGIQSIMEEYGFCIILDVFSQSQVKAMEDTMEDDLHELVYEDEIMNKYSFKMQQIHKIAKEQGVAKWPYMDSPIPPLLGSAGWHPVSVEPVRFSTEHPIWLSISTMQWWPMIVNWRRNEMPIGLILIETTMIHHFLI